MGIFARPKAHTEACRPRPSHASWIAQAGMAGAMLTVLVTLASHMFWGWDQERIIIEEGVILGLGIIATWRYGWWALHFTRAMIYAAIVYPRYRARAEAVPPARLPRQIFVLITSYKTRPDITARVYRALFRDAQLFAARDHEVTIVSAYGDLRDECGIREAYLEAGIVRGVQLALVQQDGTGKRAAMVEALKVIRDRRPDPDALVVFMDGDSLLVPGTLARCAGFFVADPALGAVTTDNRAIADGSNTMREWYELRLTQRHLLMQSMALSRKLLVLTGRFSMFRAAEVTQQRFITRLGEDAIEHWRLGRIRFLSGDDKSTWYELLRHGADMLYLSDVTVFNFEDPPYPSFMRSSVALMRRWYGNMLRTSGRAIALGPRRLGLFAWWSLIDQRISMWTTMIGPISVTLLATQYGLRIVGAYGVWVVLSRTFVGLVLGLMRGRISAFYMPLLVYGQIGGAAIKIAVAFRMNVQRWTRQKIQTAVAPGQARQVLIGRLMIATAVGWLALAVGSVSQVIKLPDGMTIAMISDVTGGRR